MPKYGNKPSPLRGEVHEYIKAHPGAKMVEICAHFNLPIERVDHHVRRLVYGGHVTAFKTVGIGMARLYYDAAVAPDAPSGDLISECKRKWLGMDIHKIIGGGGGIVMTAKKLARISEIKTAITPSQIV